MLVGRTVGHWVCPGTGANQPTNQAATKAQLPRPVIGERASEQRTLKPPVPARPSQHVHAHLRHRQRSICRASERPRRGRRAFLAWLAHFRAGLPFAVLDLAPCARRESSDAVKGHRARCGKSLGEKKRKKEQQHKDCGSGESGRRCGGREIRSPGVVVVFGGVG